MNQEDRNQFQQTEQEQTDYRSSYSYDHTYEQDPTQGGYPSHTPKPTNGLAIACLVVGILSIVTCCCGLGGVIFGCTGIFLAVMSRENRLMPTNAKIGLGLSIARSMARMHGGDVTLENRPEGGLKATATFKRS